MADKSQVGREYELAPWEVERCKIKELAWAIGDPNPIYTDKEAAAKEGYQDIPAPPTYATVPGNWQSNTGQFMDDLGINYMMIVHGGEEYEYHKEIYPGDVISGKTTVASVVEKESKSGSKMDIVIIETVYNNQNNEKVLTARTTIIERK
ncbi:MAG: MaoC family dehydratase N-terminal domain-containing protein [Chloroflexi bacterium]|nr:MaoC family dehydratase N-terminal domain-containing protein [Chloroflexota bacterium]